MEFAAAHTIGFDGAEIRILCRKLPTFDEFDECPVHPYSRLGLKAWHYVAVKIECDRDCRMAEQFLNDLGVVALLQAQ